MKNDQFSTKDTLNRTLPIVSPVNFPKILEENVGNFCPVCGKTIFSNLLEIDGKVYLEKNCCKKELVFMENDVEFFKNHRNNTKIEPIVSDPQNYKEWSSEQPNCGSSSVALYVTTRCNQNCPICFMKFHNNCLSQNQEPVILEKIAKEMKKYKSRQVYLLGGEPTTRKDLFEIVKIIKDSGNIPGIYTNGLKLEDKNYLKKLKKAGLSIIVLQFDGFDRAANVRLRGQDYLERQLKVLKNVKEVGGIKLQLSPVIERGMNENEIPKIIQFALENKFINSVSFLGLLPLPYEKKIPTTHSDLIKTMEREGYFDRKYFLELVKMYRNIYEVTKKIFKGSQLEKWILNRLSTTFNVVYFKRETNFLRLLFRKEEIEKINKILIKSMDKKSRIASFYVLLKNLLVFIKSPLTILLRENFFVIKKRGSSSNKLLEVGFHILTGPRNKLLKQVRPMTVLFLVNVLAPLAFAVEEQN